MHASRRGVRGAFPAACLARANELGGGGGAVGRGAAEHASAATVSAPGWSNLVVRIAVYLFLALAFSLVPG